MRESRGAIVQGDIPQMSSRMQARTSSSFTRQRLNNPGRKEGGLHHHRLTFPCLPRVRSRKKEAIALVPIVRLIQQQHFFRALQSPIVLVFPAKLEISEEKLSGTRPYHVLTRIRTPAIHCQLSRESLKQKQTDCIWCWPAVSSWL